MKGDKTLKEFYKTAMVAFYSSRIEKAAKCIITIIARL
jgi:hypothetical protein